MNPRRELVAVYDKWHVCHQGDCAEGDYFCAGMGELASFQIKGIGIGLCICYDIRFPELVRTLTVAHGISLLIHPGGWPRDAGFASWHPFIITRAVENSIYIISANRAGATNGHAVFCPPYVNGNDLEPTMLPDPDAEGLLVGQVNLDQLADLRSQ